MFLPIDMINRCCFKKYFWSDLSPYPNILLPKAYENLSKYVHRVTNCASLDYLGVNDPYMAFELGSHVCPYTIICLFKSHENPSKYVDTVNNWAYLDH